MEAKQLVCPGCTAPIRIDVKKGRNITCQYCGASITIDAATWKDAIQAEQALDEFHEADRKREISQAERAQVAAAEEKRWKNWKIQVWALLALVTVLTTVNFALPSGTSLADSFNMVWGTVMIASTIYLAVRRPEMTQYQPKSTLAKGGKALAYLKLVGIKWGLMILGAMAADLFH